MKKLITLITVLALTVCAVGMTVSAHGGHHSSGHRTTTKTNIVYRCTEDCSYTDKDGDGICDSCNSKGWYCKNSCAYADKDGDGICDNCSTKGICSYKPRSKTRHCHN